MPYDLKYFEEKGKSSEEWLEREYKTLRTGRASPALLDAVKVNAYGSMMPLKQVANVSIEDPRTLRVSPYDASLVKDIERAIAAADLGIGTGSDQAGVRVTIPELSTERRAQLIKIAKQKLEEARISVRVARDDVWKDIQEKEREGAMPENDKFRLKEELQKKVDTVNERLEKMYEKKEVEMNG